MTRQPPALGAVVLAAEMLNDLERVRVATGQRATALRDVYGLTGSAEEATHLALEGALARIEHDAELALKRAMRRHPLGPWIIATKGLGERQIGRLLACIGDPAWHPVHDRPRGLYELNAYCGVHTVPAGGDGARVGARRQRGQQSNWNGDARMRLYLIAVTCVKLRTSAYRAVYDAGRTRYATALHAAPCIGCKATAGEPLTPGHQHNRALRLVMKAVLKDLWLEARRVRGFSDEATVTAGAA